MSNVVNLPGVSGAMPCALWSPPPENNRINLGRCHKPGMRWQLLNQKESYTFCQSMMALCCHVQYADGSDSSGSNQAVQSQSTTWFWSFSSENVHVYMKDTDKSADVYSFYSLWPIGRVSYICQGRCLNLGTTGGNNPSINPYKNITRFIQKNIC